MNKLRKKYTDQGYLNKLLVTRTKKYQSAETDEEIPIEPSQGGISALSRKNSSKPTASKFEKSNAMKGHAPEKSKFESYLDVFRERLPKFVEVDPRVYKEISQMITSDINKEIWNVQYQLEKGLANQKKKKVAQKLSDDGPSLPDVIMKRAHEVLEMSYPSKQKIKGLSLQGDDKHYAQKFGLRGGLLMKLYDESTKKVEDKLKLTLDKQLRQTVSHSPSKNKNSETGLEEKKKSFSIKGGSFATLRSPRTLKHIPSGSNLKKYMTRGDIYFKDYIEEKAPDEFKPKMQTLQTLIADFNDKDEPKGKKLLNNFCNLGKTFKKIKQFSHSNTDELITPQLYYKKFKRLVAKEENERKTRFIGTRVRRASLNSKILKAIT